MFYDQIGTHIHYYYSHYKKYGLSLKSSSSYTKKTIADIIEEQHKKLIAEATARGKRFPDDFKKEFSLLANIASKSTFLNGNQEELLKQLLELKDDTDIKPLVDAITAALHTRMQNLGYGAADINMDTLMATQKTVKDFQFTANQLREVKAGHYFRTINNILRQVGKFASKLQELGESSKKDAQSLMQRVRALRADLQQFTQKGGKIINTLYMFDQQVNQLLQDAKRLQIENLRGILYEEYLGIIGSMFSKIISSKTVELTDLIASVKASGQASQENLGIVADRKSHKIITPTNFHKNINLDNWLTADIDKDGTKDKVDLHITVNPDNIVNASLKNVNYWSSYHHGISFHGGSGVKILQQYGEFVNHYLNITVTNEGRQRESARPSNVELQQLHNMLKASFIVQGMMGGQLTDSGTNEQVDVLIIARDGVTEIFDVGELISRILKNLTEMAQYINGTGVDKVSQLTSEWVGTKFIANHGEARQRTTATTEKFLSGINKVDLKINLHKMGLLNSL